MTLVVLASQRKLFQGRVRKVVAQGVGGSRGYLPHHIDFVTVLLPSVLSAVLEDGSERFFAVQGGVLVKKGARLTVTTRHAVMSDDLQSLPETVERWFADEEEMERRSRRVLHQLESHLVKELFEWVH